MLVTAMGRGRVVRRTVVIMLVVQIVEDDVHHQRRSQKRENEDGEKAEGRAAHERIRSVPEKMRRGKKIPEGLWSWSGSGR